MSSGLVMADPLASRAGRCGLGGDGRLGRSGAGPLLHDFQGLLHMLQAMPANIKLWPREA